MYLDLNVCNFILINFFNPEKVNVFLTENISSHDTRCVWKVLRQHEFSPSDLTRQLPLLEAFLEIFFKEPPSICLNVFNGVKLLPFECTYQVRRHVFIFDPIKPFLGYLKSIFFLIVGQ